jgi:hypothetical protein
MLTIAIGNDSMGYCWAEIYYFGSLDVLERRGSSDWRKKLKSGGLLKRIIHRRWDRFIFLRPSAILLRRTRIHTSLGLKGGPYQYPMYNVFSLEIDSCKI